jgi:hypothetical protein
MSQILQKPYECLTCKQQIKIAKIDNVPPGQKKKWDKFEMDGITPHICRKHEQQQQQQTPQQQPTGTPVGGGTTDVSKEIAAIKAQLLVLVNRLNRIEAELQK